MTSSTPETLRAAYHRLLPKPGGVKRVLTLADHYLTLVAYTHADCDSVEAAAALREAADRLDPGDAKVDAQALLDLHRAADGVWRILADQDIGTPLVEALSALEGALDATEDYLTAVGLLPGVPEPVIEGCQDGRAAA